MRQGNEIRRDHEHRGAVVLGANFGNHLHAPQFLPPFVEFVVADRRDGETHRVHRLNRRFVVKECGEEGRRAHEIPCGDYDGIRVLRQCAGQVRG